MPNIKFPALLALDFKTGTVSRYLRKFDVSGASLGWQLTATHKATFNSSEPLPPAVLEKFRDTGYVG